MKKILLISTLFISYCLNAQTPDEALRTAWFTQNGTARNTAIGGVMGSLGGDITAANINPAGLGLYKTKEMVFTMGGMKNNNEFNYRDSLRTNDKGVFRYGTIGMVFGVTNPYKRESLRSSAFSFSLNQLASYNNRISFKGFNNYSSFSEQYLEELSRDNADTNSALSNYIFGSSLAFRTYLIDTATDAAGKFIGYQSMVPISTGVIQDYNAVTRGGYHEFALGFASNYNDRVYVGGSITIPFISYKRDLTYGEKDATNNPNNNFSYFNYKESLSSFGIGFGLKLGAIYKPTDNVRLGLAFHTPQVIGFTDKIRSSMITNTEAYASTKSESSDNLNDNKAGERKYTMTTPYRVIASASYVFSELENTKKQRGFISADVEFVNYRGARFSKTSENGDVIKNYYKELNSSIKDVYKGNVNFKVGGELKFDPIMVRLGAAYYGSPYADDNIKADKLVLSAGIGYRSKGMFIDLSVAQSMLNDAQFPYRLNDKANTYAVQTGNVQNVMMTVGFKL
jgi:long-subunit fatty acid transport protein